jgi:hypothetical protein
LKAQKVDLGTAFGERKQAARMLGDTAISIAKSIRNLKHGNVRQAMVDLGISRKKSLPRGSNVPNKWLELQYGWKPLMSDVFGAVDALSKRQRSDWRVTAKATRKVETVVSKDINGFYQSTCRAQVLQSVFTRIDALPDNEAIISLVSLGVLNPFNVAWELVPFSFVVDWALPIGDYLQSLDALLGYTSITYSQSSLVKASWVDRGRTGMLSSPADWIAINEFEGSKKVVRFQRTVGIGVPMPNFPSVKDPRSLGHMANGLSLLCQVFGRRGPTYR